MALQSPQQAQDIILRSRRVLLITKQHATLDAIASMAAMGRFLQKLGKSFDMVIPDARPDTFPKFLTFPGAVRPQLGALRSLHLTLDVSTKPLAELSYDVKNGKLDITLVPKLVEWQPQDMAFRYGDDLFDAVIAFDCSDRASLGALAREQADFLYRVNVINIDHHNANEHWGQVNLVDLNAVSTSEVLYTWLQAWNQAALDQETATALLAGMIEKTKSFRTANVTPRTLAAASTLVALGAKREEIVHALWRTRTVATLKLWGRALSRLEQDRELGLVWTTLTETDFLESGAAPDALDGVVDELIAYAPDAKIVALLYPQDHGLSVNLYAQSPFSAADLARPFGGQGTRERAVFTFSEPGHPTEQAKVVTTRLQEMLRSIKPTS